MTAPTCECGEEMDVEEGRLYEVARCATGECDALGVRYTAAIRERLEDPSRLEQRFADLLELHDVVLEAARGFDVREARDELVDRLVIRGECVHEPCVSDGWMKPRMVLVGLLPALLVFALLEAVGAPAFVTVLVSIGVAVGTIRTVAVRIRVVQAATECERQDFFSGESGG